jgi:hypothetical protein
MKTLRALMSCPSFRVLLLALLAASLQPGSSLIIFTKNPGQLLGHHFLSLTVGGRPVSLADRSDVGFLRNTAFLAMPAPCPVAI